MSIKKLKRNMDDGCLMIEMKVLHKGLFYYENERQ